MPCKCTENPSLPGMRHCLWTDSASLFPYHYSRQFPPLQPQKAKIQKNLISVFVEFDENASEKGGVIPDSKLHFHAAIRSDGQHMTGALPQHSVHAGAEILQNIHRHKGLYGAGKAAAMDPVGTTVTQ